MDALGAVDDAVDVWLSPVGDGPADEGLALLDTDERQRWERFVFDADRRLYAHAHALLRRTLSRYRGQAPRSWRFAAGPWGRPEIAGDDGDGLRFNLTHCRGLAVVAVTRGRTVGVDAEAIDRPLDWDGVAGYAFGPAERQELDSVPESRRPALFFTLWTLKEAYVKARGLGLSLPLGDFRVQADPPGIIPAADDPDRWLAACFQPGPGHRVSLAVPRNPDGSAPPVRWYDAQTLCRIDRPMIA